MQEKIKQIIISNLKIYLQDHLKRVPEEKHEIAKQYFHRDMQRIIDYCYENFYKLLSEDFIKWLHKSLYPEWYIQKAKDEKWRDFIWMIPWEYKKIKIIAKENENQDIYEKVENVEKSMKKLIDDFNINILQSSFENEKKDLIFLFAVDFVSIHPFWDWNGRLDGILIDLLCLKYNIEHFWLVKIYKKNKITFISILNEVRKTRNPKIFYNFIEKYKN